MFLCHLKSSQTMSLAKTTSYKYLPSNACSHRGLWLGQGYNDKSYHFRAQKMTLEPNYEIYLHVLIHLTPTTTWPGWCHTSHFTDEVTELKVPKLVNGWEPNLSPSLWCSAECDPACERVLPLKYDEVKDVVQWWHINHVLDIGTGLNAFLIESYNSPMRPALLFSSVCGGGSW